MTEFCRMIRSLLFLDKQRFAFEFGTRENRECRFQNRIFEF